MEKLQVHLLVSCETHSTIDKHKLFTDVKKRFLKQNFYRAFFFSKKSMCFFKKKCVVSKVIA